VGAFNHRAAGGVRARRWFCQAAAGVRCDGRACASSAHLHQKEDILREVQRGDFMSSPKPPSSASNSEEEEDEAAETGAELKPKIWRAAVVQEFKDNIIIRVGLEIAEGGEKMKLHEIFFR
jgi:hypothetical protein